MKNVVSVNVKMSSRGGVDVKKLIKDLTRKQVLVGIPEEKGERSKGTITNAQLLFIHTNGSPANNIPARPVLEPAIKASGNIEPITEELKEASVAALDGKPNETNKHLNRAGMEAQNASRAWFTDARNGWRENSKNPLGKFLARKLSEALGKHITPEMSYYDVKQMYASGEGEPVPLVFYGEMRKAIIYILKDGK